MSHDCRYIVGFDTESEGEPIFCGKNAPLRRFRFWLCAEHFDLMERQPSPAMRTGGTKQGTKGTTTP